jgi:predicted CXXCH cytochrome family protein
MRPITFHTSSPIRKVSTRLAGLAGVVLAVAAVLGGAGTAQPTRFVHSEDGCTRCHQLDPLFSHPVGITPRHRLPDELPLLGGRLACTTCHSTRPDDGHDRRSPAGNPMLRPAAASCRACHETRGSMHATDGVRAHLVTERSSSTGTRFSLDLESMGCVGCHDGSVARAAMHRPFTSGDLGSGHPVGIDYGVSRRGSLRPEGALDDRIRLFDGRLGCGTCHSPYAGGRGQLVIPNDRSRLCMGCHDF